MATTSQIRKIHALKNAIGLEDDLYREMLVPFNVQSSKELNSKQAGELMEVLEEKAIALNRWKKYPKKYDGLERENMATPAQLRMIEGVWREICYVDNEQSAKKSLRKFLKSKFHTDDVMFLTRNKAIKVIQGLMSMKRRIKKVRPHVVNRQKRRKEKWNKTK